MRKSADAAGSADELLRLLDKAGIGRALIWHIAQAEVSPPEGNQRLSEIIAGSDRLWGCWTLLPPQTGELKEQELFARMAESRIVALRAFPESQNYFLNRTVFGPFLDEVAARRIPLLLSPEQGASWLTIYGVLRDYPDLTCILCDIGIWGQDRRTWPLLEQYPRVHVETSLVSLEAGGLEAAVRRFGAERFVFGSALPRRYAEGPLLDLLHADIAETDKRKIAAGNLERLIAEVKR